MGVTGYRVFRGTTQIARLGAAATSYTDTGLAAGPYSYTVQAVDAARNLSDPSNTASATVPDTTKPTAPGNLTAHAGTGQVALSWQASSDNVGVTGYRVFRGATQIASLGAGATSYTDTGLAAGSLQLHGAGHRRGGQPLRPEQHRDATVPDTTKPTAPGNLTATGHRPRRRADMAGLDRQRRCDRLPDLPRGHQIATVGRDVDVLHRSGPPGRDVPLRGPCPGRGAATSPTRATRQRPSCPTPRSRPPPGTSPQAGQPGEARSDVAGIDRRRGRHGLPRLPRRNPFGTAAANATTYADTSLPPGTYSYTVRAVDAATNLSDPSNTASATVPDTTEADRARKPPGDGRVEAGRADAGRRRPTTSA